MSPKGSMGLLLDSLPDWTTTRRNSSPFRLSALSASTWSNHSFQDVQVFYHLSGSFGKLSIGFTESLSHLNLNHFYKGHNMRLLMVIHVWNSMFSSFSPRTHQSIYFSDLSICICSSPYIVLGPMSCYPQVYNDYLNDHLGTLWTVLKT